MLKGKGIPNNLWVEACHTAVYILNRSPTKAVRDKTPFEAWHNRKPTVDHLKIFGSIAYALIPTQNREKFDEKGEKYLFIGYSDESNGYRLLNPTTNKLVISRDVVFDEASAWQWEKDQSQASSFFEAPVSPPNSSQQNNLEPNSPNSAAENSSDDESPPRKIKSMREIYESCELALFSCEPQDFEEASRNEDWIKAMNEEMATIVKNKTWEMVNLPNGKETIGLKWIFKIKYNEDGSVQKYKAWLVAKGYSQLRGVDFTETFAPVARMETIRTVLALAAQIELNVFQLDVKSAFLNGEIEEEVYVEQPKGYEVKGTDFLIVCLYVDDLIYCGTNLKMVEEFKKSMLDEFEMTDLGLMKYFLGIQVKQARGKIFFCQEKYVEDLLKKFHVFKCKPAPTPMGLNEKLKHDEKEEKADARIYRSLVGSLIYLTNSRPDILHSVSVLSRFMNDPRKSHYIAANRILRYLQGTKKQGIMYEKEDNCKLVGFTDSDWAGSLDDRKSTAGYLFCLGTNVISWSSRKQKSVTLSSAEAKYIAATESACEAVWLRRILKDLQFNQDAAITIYCDNMSAIALTKNPVFHAKSKHIELCYHYIRDLVSKGEVNMEFISTNEQPADFLTKAIIIEKFEKFKKQLKITN
ncbi:Integrase catalytic domain-containing protein [Citrus sinensis]|nr:Integrase catalytic domain-containing protein [Citrus sinensis]